MPWRKIHTVVAHIAIASYKLHSKPPGRGTSFWGPWNALTIRNETEATYHLQAQIAQAVLSRDKAITALLDHRRTDVKSARAM